MLVATQYESIESIESSLKQYVKLNIEAHEQSEVIVDDYSLDDSRLELSSTAKPIVLKNTGTLSNNEVFISDIVLPDIKPSISDMLPVDLKQEFVYEKRVNDTNRTLLLQKNLALVTLIQEIQDELERQDTEDDFESDSVETIENVTQIEVNSENTAPNEFVELDLTDDTTFGASDLDTFEPTTDTVIDDFTLEDEDSTVSVETDDFTLEEELSTEGNDIDDFTLDEEPLMESSEIDEFDLETGTATTDIDEFDLETGTATTDIDDFTLEDNVVADTNDIEDFNIEDTIDSDDTDVEDFSLDSAEVDSSIEDDTISTESSDIDDFTLNNTEETVSTLETPSSTESTSVLSDLEVFTSVMKDGNSSVPKKEYKPKKVMDENVDIGLEDLESVSEDEIDTDTADLDFDLDTSSDTEEQIENQDLENSDIDEDELDEDELDEDELNEDELDEDDLDEDDLDEDELDEDDLDDIDFEEDATNEIEPKGSDIESEPYIDKVDDNIDFVDETNVSLSKPKIDKNRVIPKSELGRVLANKAEGKNHIAEKQTFLQGFDKSVETDKNKEEMVSEFKETLQSSTVSKADSSVNKPEKRIVQDTPAELPPLRNYLKKHPYTPIEELVSVGYSMAEIQDGVRRGKLVRKNGMLRALF